MGSTCRTVGSISARAQSEQFSDRSDNAYAHIAVSHIRESVFFSHAHAMSQVLNSIFNPHFSGVKLPQIPEPFCSRGRFEINCLCLAQRLSPVEVSMSGAEAGGKSFRVSDACFFSCSKHFWMFHESCVLAGQALPSPDEAGISLSTRIARLKAVKQEALAKKKLMAKELKAAQKKLKKVKGALSLLSDEDLNQAVRDRQAAAKAAAKAAAHP